MPLHFWLPRRARGGAEPRLGAHVRRRHQDRASTGSSGSPRLLDAPPAWWGVRSSRLGRGLGRARRRLRARAARPEAAARLPQHREHRDHRARASGSRSSGAPAGEPALVAARARPARLLHVVNHALFKSLLFLGAGRGPCTRPAPARSTAWAGSPRRMPRTALALPRRRGGHLRAAAAERLRQRVARLPRASSRARRSRGRPRRVARPGASRSLALVGGARRRLLREGRRGRVPRQPRAAPAAHARTRRRAPMLAPMAVLAARLRRHRPRARRRRSRRWRARRRPGRGSTPRCSPARRRARPRRLAREPGVAALLLPRGGASLCGCRRRRLAAAAARASVETWGCGFVAPDRAHAVHRLLLRRAARAPLLLGAAARGARRRRSSGLFPAPAALPHRGPGHRARPRCSCRWRAATRWLRQPRAPAPPAPRPAPAAARPRDARRSSSPGGS